MRLAIDRRTGCWRHTDWRRARPSLRLRHDELPAAAPMVRWALAAGGLVRLRSARDAPFVDHRPGGAAGNRGGSTRLSFGLRPNLTPLRGVICVPVAPRANKPLQAQS